LAQAAVLRGLLRDLTPPHKDLGGNLMHVNVGLMQAGAGDTRGRKEREGRGSRWRLYLGGWEKK
jgi:hypothetical protein